MTTAPYRYQARILVHAPAETVAEQVPPSAGVLEPAGPDSCMLVSGSDSLDAIAVMVAMMGLRFSVLEPPELIERMRVLAASLAAAAGPEQAAPGGGPTGRPAP